MKTSNKIIIAISFIIIGSTLTLFITAKLHEKWVKNSIVMKTTVLKPFSVVVAEDSANVYFNKTSDYITIERNSDDKITKQSYKKISVIDVETNKLKPTINQPFKQIGDTLFLFKGSKLHVHSSTNITSVIGKNHEKLEFMGFDSDTIYFNLKGGETVFNNSKKNKTNYFRIFACDGAELRFDLNTVKLVIDADKSRIFMNGEIDNFKGEFKNNSELWGISTPKTIEFMKDSTCNIQ